MPLVIALAEVRRVQERFDEVEVLYGEILAESARTQTPMVTVMNNLAELLALRRHRLDEALGMINTAIEKAGPVSNLLDTRASVFLALNQPDKALEDMKAVVADEPKANYYFHLAQAYYGVGDIQAARDAIRRAREIGLEIGQLHPLERSSLKELLDRAK